MSEQRKPQHWRVAVDADGETILTIESNMLAGIPNIDEYADTVRNCAEHLLSFIGTPSLPQEGEVEKLGDMWALQNQLLEEFEKYWVENHIPSDPIGSREYKIAKDAVLHLLVTMPGPSQPVEGDNN